MLPSAELSMSMPGNEGHEGHEGAESHEGDEGDEDDEGLACEAICPDIILSSLHKSGVLS